MWAHVDIRDLKGERGVGGVGEHRAGEKGEEGNARDRSHHHSNLGDYIKAVGLQPDRPSLHAY